MRLVRFFPLVALVACSKLTSPPGPEPIASDTPVTMASAPTVPSARPIPQQPPKELAPPPGDLKIDDEVVGKGPAVKNGDTVVVHYTGTLLDGTKFDSSKDRNQPFTTQIPGQLIQGWNQGIVGLKVGSRVQLDIPTDLAYGSNPPSADTQGPLRFVIDVLDAS